MATITQNQNRISSIEDNVVSPICSLDIYYNYSITANHPSSIESSQKDPDLLIRDYFLSSLEQRYKCRKNIIKRLEKLEYFYFMEVLSYGASGKYKESYEGAINLLAETDNFLLLKTISTFSQRIYNLLVQQSLRNEAENFLEILINTIACAYKINVNYRFDLLVNVIPKINSRMLKASIIDALGLIADEMDIEVIKQEIKKFISDEDNYISNYAKETLQDIE